MKFIKVKATGQPVKGKEYERFEKTFYLNTDLIKLISGDGQIFLFDNGCDTRDNFLWNDHEMFFDIRVCDFVGVEENAFQKNESSLFT